MNILWFLLSVAVSQLNAQIPTMCIENVTSTEKVCCPKANQLNGLECGGFMRGECGSVTVFHEPVKDIWHEIDDRFEWPRRFFHRLCQCKDRFWGVACEQCDFGWTGSNCSTKLPLLVRKNFKSLSKEDAELFRNLVVRSDQLISDYSLIKESDLIHSDPLYLPTFLPITWHKFFAAMHRYSSRSILFLNQQICKLNGKMDYSHGATMFALWHRYLMMLWEKVLGEIARKEFGLNSYAIPYWDWIDATYCEPCNNEWAGSSHLLSNSKEELYARISPESPFRNFLEYCQPPDVGTKCYGCHFRQDYQPLNRYWKLTDFPNSTDLQYVLAKKIFYIANEKDRCVSFHKSFEGFCGPDKYDTDTYLWMHNRVHNMVSGSFCCAATAANDPLFILHHSQIDRIVQCWHMLHQPSPNQLPMEGVEPGNTGESNMVGFIPVIRNVDVFKDIKYLGYGYDNYKFGKSQIDCLNFLDN